MAKNKTTNNDLFKGFNPPKINKTETKESSVVTDDEIEKAATEETVSKSSEPEKIVPVSEVKPTPVINDMAYAMPAFGRPKVMEGKYHNYNARIREDLFEYAQSCAGKNKPYQSVNDYINRLIARDMLSK